MTPASSIPSLRADLVVREHRQPGGPVFVVKDPVAGRFFRFREPEWYIARQLDGLTSLDIVRQRVQERFSCDLTPAALEQFVGMLRRCALLEAEGAGPGGDAGAGRVRGSVLYLRFKAFDPDRLLTRLAPRLRVFFTSGFLSVSALVVLLALAITFLSHDAIQGDLRSLWRFDALLLAWVTVLLVTAVHEFAHAFACKHFGGEVREMGFMLIYFQPAFYCNVSDAWLFPRKSRRLWVTFAGAYIEIYVWALATLAWRLVEPQTWLSFLAMVVMATSGIKTLFNLNPLIKLDGYYLLSDWLEIPNLRQKSLGYLGACLGRPFHAGTQEPEAPTPRERRIFLTYGLLAGAYSSWLLGFIALRLGGYLIERYRGLGFVLFGGFLVVLLRHPITRLRSRAGAAVRAAWARAGWRVPIKLLAGAAPVACLLLFGRMELTVPGAFTALPLHNADIEAEVEGFVSAILVDEGDRVEAGHVIARLSNRDLLDELEEVEAEIEQKRAELGMRLSRARSAVEKAQARLEYGFRELERADALLAEGLIPPQQHDDVEEDVAVRRKDLEEAQEELSQLDPADATARPGPIPFNPRRRSLDLARSELARLETHRRHLEERIRLLTVASPVSGVVTTPRLELEQRVGQFVGKGDLIAEVHELRTLTGEIAVSEKDIGEVRPGLDVVVRVRAYPDWRFEGKVVSIAAAASRLDPQEGAAAAWQRERTFLVTTELDNPSLLLKSGMTGHAKISCGRRRPIDLLARKVAGYLRVEFWSWW